jgi:hypothetical protein
MDESPAAAQGQDKPKVYQVPVYKFRRFEEPKKTYPIPYTKKTHRRVVEEESRPGILPSDTLPLRREA